MYGGLGEDGGGLLDGGAAGVTKRLNGAALFRVPAQEHEHGVTEHAKASARLCRQPRRLPR